MLRRVLASLVKPQTTASARSFLNVGGGSKQAPVPGHYAGWKHVLLDINPAGGVDIALDARRLQELPPEAFDAVYCSHNLEHYYGHEVPGVLAGFAHVLKRHGFVELRVPDLAAVMQETVQRSLDVEDTLYRSPAGPISVRDVLYGFGAEIRRGNEFYAHKTGFTMRSLQRVLAEAGFGHVFPLPPMGGFEVRVAAFLDAPREEERTLLAIAPG